MSKQNDATKKAADLHAELEAAARDKKALHREGQEGTERLQSEIEALKSKLEEQHATEEHLSTNLKQMQSEAATSKDQLAKTKADLERANADRSTYPVIPSQTSLLKCK